MIMMKQEKQKFQATIKELQKSHQKRLSEVSNLQDQITNYEQIINEFQTSSKRKNQMAPSRNTQREGKMKSQFISQLDDQREKLRLHFSRMEKERSKYTN